MFENIKLKNTFNIFLNKIIRDSQAQGKKNIEERFRFIENVVIIFIENTMSEKYKKKQDERIMTEDENIKQFNKIRYRLYSLFNKRMKKLKKKENMVHKNIGEKTIEKVIALHARVIKEERNKNKKKQV